MKVLMTGATGLIGRQLGKRLVEKGHVIVALSRRPERARRELPFPAEILPWAGDEADVPPAALENIGAVIHLAGEPVAGGRWTAARKDRIRNSRVRGTERLVESLRANPSAARTLKTFVMGSAIGFYGDRGDDVVDESSAPGEDFLARVCVDWERAGSELLNDSRFAAVRFACIRTGIVLAREGGALPTMLATFARGLGGKLGHGRQWMSWIHLDDIVGLFVAALENPSYVGAINGVAPHPTQNETFSNALAKAVGKGLLFPVPETALRAGLGEMATMILGGARVSAARAEELGYRFAWPDVSEALNALCAPERDGDRELVAEQWVPRAIDDVFRFFSDEKNLEALTPPFLSFQVVGMSTPQIERGTLIDYRLSLRGVPIKWRTEISEWEPGRRFVDEQLKGPYAKWHHTHEFEPFAGGTLMRDRVRYRLPLGSFGDAVAGWKVRSDVGAIFNFRREKIAEVFP